jgi:hypothetical protein
MMLRCLIVIGLWLPVDALAQNTLHGRIENAKTGDAIPFASVYISGTTKGTLADELGSFRLLGATNGAVLVVSAIGYEPYQHAILPAEITDKPLTISLMPQTAILNEVAVKAKRDKTWDRQLARFKDLFFGDSPNRAQCNILNAWVIDFATTADGALQATASQPIDIENRALGYRLHYTLLDFLASRQQTRFKGTCLFEEMPTTTPKQTKRRLQNRQQTFDRSLRAFLYNLIHGEAAPETYTIHRITNHNFLTNSTWGHNKAFYSKDNELTVTQIAKPVLGSDGLVNLALSLPIEVVINSLYVTINSEEAISRNPISRLRALKSPVLITTNGLLQDPTAVEVVGYWAEERVADMLPTDYHVDTTQQATSITRQVSPFEPKIFLQTSKQIYAPGEKIWLSAYLTNAVSGQLLTQPHPLYVQIYAPNGEKIADEILYTEAGRGNGFVMLPATVGHGQYRIRAFIQSMVWAHQPARQQTVFVGSLPTDYQIDSLSKNSEMLRLEADKPTYGKRQPVQVKLLADSALAATVSISVYRTLPNERGLVVLPSRVKHVDSVVVMTPEPAEGLVFAGRVVRPSGEAVVGGQVVLLLTLSDGQRSRIALTDTAGMFRFIGLPLLGQQSVVYQVNDSKGQVITDASVQWIQFPRVAVRIDSLPAPAQPIISRNGLPLIPIADGDAPAPVAKAIELAEVTVTEKRTDLNLTGTFKLHTEANFAINFGKDNPAWGTTPEDLYQMLRMLPSCTGSTLKYLIDGMIVEQPHEIINPQQIVRLEFLRGANAAIYGADCIYAIYTRRFGNATDPGSIATQTQRVRLRGYQPPQQFYMPDYETKKSSEPDNRQTLYWNPELILLPNQPNQPIRFYTSDIPGTYLIQLQGMTDKGPVFAERTITVR